ncbi:MAG: hypothetical protein IH904_05940 [Proteobacteria bacterium]|nr:hypothetical protein [Pseudomonadota bacterium]
MEQDVRWIVERAERVRDRLDEFDRAGDLTGLTPSELRDQVKLIKEADVLCAAILEEHERNFPSTLWFAVAFLSGLGGLAYFEPTLGPIIITVGGIAGAAKSLYDRGAHLIAEQKYLGLYGSVVDRKDALRVELTRRAIR